MSGHNLALTPYFTARYLVSGLEGGSGSKRARECQSDCIGTHCIPKNGIRALHIYEA